MSMDFNDAESNSYDLIPKGTVAPLIMTIRPGSAGDGGWETKSRNSDYTYLNCEFTVTDGPFAKRKFWGNMMVGHPEYGNGDNKPTTAINMTRATLRGILESSRGIKPDDESEGAKAKRIVQGYGDFDAIEFVGEIGFEPGKDGYDDKNTLQGAVPITSKKHPKNGGTVEAKPAAKETASSSAAPDWAS